MMKKIKDRKQRERRPIEPVQKDGQGGGLARALASTDGYTRERGLQALTLWLKGHKNISEKDLLRLWKALFYCFWHSDKAPVQNALAERLSEIMVEVPRAVGQLYFRMFVKTMRREWFGIDRHRLDKFMMLVRKFFSAHLRYLRMTDWQLEILTEYAHFWQFEVFLPSDTLVASGLSYQIVDIFLNEVYSHSKQYGPVESHDIIILLLEPFCAAAAYTSDKILLQKLREHLFSQIAVDLGQKRKVAIAWKHLDRTKLAAKLFELGAQTEVRALNREMLYACSRAIEGAASGDDFKMPLVPGAPLSPSISVAEETEAEAEAGTKAKAKAKTKTKRAVVGKGKADVVENGVQAAANGKKKRKSIKSGDDSTEIAPKGEGLPVVAEHSKGEHLSRPVENGKLDEDTYEVQKMDKMVKKKKNKKKKKKLSLDSDSEPGNLIKAPPPEEGLTPIQSPSRPGESTAKKNVRFSLKRNLVMTIGQPPLPEDIRTPPTAKPRGPALKRVSSVAENSPPVRIMKMTSPKSETRSPIMTRSAMKAKKSLNVSFSTSPKRNRGKQSR